MVLKNLYVCSSVTNFDGNHLWTVKKGWAGIVWVIHSLFAHFCFKKVIFEKNNLLQLNRAPPKINLVVLS